MFPQTRRTTSVSAPLPSLSPLTRSTPSTDIQRTIVVITAFMLHHYMKTYYVIYCYNYFFIYSYLFRPRLKAALVGLGDIKQGKTSRWRIPSRRIQRGDSSAAIGKKRRLRKLCPGFEKPTSAGRCRWRFFRSAFVGRRRQPLISRSPVVRPARSLQPTGIQVPRSSDARLPGDRSCEAGVFEIERVAIV